MKGWSKRLEWKRVWVILLATIFLLHFVVVGFGILLRNTNSNSGDQGAFLSLGLAIRRGRALTDGNRQPLFPLLIAPFARREWSYFTISKLISVCAGVAALVSVLLGGRRLEGVEVSLAAMALLSLNREFVDQTPRVLCEALLSCLSFVGWAASVRALEQPTSRKAGAIAGALSGAVYLTKGTGNLIIIAFLTSAILVRRRRVLRSASVWTFLGVLLVVVSPLLAYNWIHYRNPFYNYNSSHAMWFESWDDHYQPEAQRPTMTTYLATHSLSQIVERQVHGMTDTLPIIAEAFRLRGLPGTGWLFAGLAAALAIWGLWAALSLKRHSQRYCPRMVLTASMLFAFYLFFSWYRPVIGAPRFYLPVAPIVYLMASRALVMVAKRLGKIARSTWFQDFCRRGYLAASVLAGLGFWCLLGVVQTWRDVPWENPFVRDARENQDAGAVIDWLNARAGTDVQVLWGPSHTLPAWKAVSTVHFQAVPSTITTWEELEQLIRASRFDYLVLDKKMYKRRRKVLETYLDKNDKVILFRSLPPGWAFAHARKGKEANWYIIDLAQTSQPPMRFLAPPVQFGEAIALRGCAVQPERVQPGASVEVTLLCEALQPMSQNFTAFVHLLNDREERFTQADSYPLGGMYPTSQWKVGETIRDPRTLLLPDGIPPGRYKLIVGFYLLGGGGRLPAARVGGQGLRPGNTFQLPQEVEVCPR